VENRPLGAPRQPALDGEALAARLEEIAGSATTAVEALEPALQAILGATGVAAGAVCLYDQRREVLRLAAEAGLSDEGCRRLRTVRRGDVAGWDMPLHSLLNRRVYLIESAAKNRYVPPLVDSSVVVRTIACLPLHAGIAPVGSLILITRMPQTLNERDIRALEPPMRQLGRVIEAVRRAASERTNQRAGAAPAAAPLRSPTRSAPIQGRTSVSPDQIARIEEERARLAAEIDALRARLAEAEAGAAHEQRVREELEAVIQRGAGSTQAELHTALEAARRAEVARAALAAENARLAADLDELRGGVPREERDVDAEVDRLRARLAEAEAGAAHEQRVREQLQIALERGSSTTQQELRHALEAARRAESARAVLQSENARLAAELQHAQAAPIDHEELAEQAAEIDRLRARLAEAEAGAAHEQRAREQLQVALERGSSASQEELRHALEAARHAEASRVTLAAEQADLRAEVARLRADAVQAQSLAAHLALAEQEQARVASTLEDSARIASEQTAEIERLRGRIAEMEAGAPAESAAKKELLAAVDAAQEERDTALRKLTALREEHGTERAESEARLREIGARLAEREHEAETLRTERTADAEAAATRLEAAEEESDRLRAVAATLESERDRFAADADGAAAARARLEEALEQGMEEARGRERDLSGRLSARERELETLRAQLASEAAVAKEERDGLAAECDRLHDSVVALESERDRLNAEVEGASAGRARLEHALEQGLEEARGRERELATRLEQAQGELDALRAERTTEAEGAAERTDALAAECEKLRAAIGTLEVERDRLGAEVQGAAAERARLVEELEQVRLESAARAAVETETPTPVETSPPVEPTMPAAPEVASAPPVAASRRAPTVTPAAGEAQLVAVLDADAAWSSVAVTGHEVLVVSPGDAPTRLPDLGPGRILVNLASAGALGALGELRDAGVTGAAWGCLADASSGRGLSLARIEVVGRPLDPDAILVALAGQATRGTRVVTVGDDVDAFVSLRQALAREGMSVSMAWNAKQAADLLPMVRPAVVVLDMELPGRDGAGIVAQLSAIEPIPALVFIVGTADSAQSLAAVLADPAHAPRAVPLPSLLATALAAG
jgi:CheY-like chemotaxis protein